MAIQMPPIAKNGGMFGKKTDDLFLQNFGMREIVSSRKERTNG